MGRTKSAVNTPTPTAAQVGRATGKMSKPPAPIRRERTYVGSVCAACEEPLEHILPGERILQLTCGHVSHEACLYEYVKEMQAADCPTCEVPLSFDSSRGGNINYEGLNRLLRVARGFEVDHSDDNNSREPTIASLDSGSAHDLNHAASGSMSDPPRSHTALDMVAASIRTDHIEDEPSESRDGSARSIGSDVPPSSYVKSLQHLSRPQSHRLSLQPSMLAPTVTLRSEFPVVYRSHNSQSLTCMVTIEVPESKWSASPQTIRHSPLVQSGRPAVQDEPSTTGPVADVLTPVSAGPVDSVQDSSECLDAIKDKLMQRVENWHGLDTDRFGKLILHGAVKVGKDRKVWQDLECYLFSEMLICVKEKKPIGQAAQTSDGTADALSKPRCVLKGSIFIKKHLEAVQKVPDCDILTLSLSVSDLPTFHLMFTDSAQLETWSRAFHRMYDADLLAASAPDSVAAGLRAEQDEVAKQRANTIRKFSRPLSVIASSQPGSLPSLESLQSPLPSTHRRSPTPMDLVVVIPISSAVHGLKVNILRDSLRFLLSILGSRDRLGIISYGSGRGATTIAPLTTTHNTSWSHKFESIQPVVQNSVKPDVVEGTSAAMDMLLRRRASNPLAQIILISDTAQADHDNIELLVSRAEMTNVGIHAFGLGTTHNPDDLIELSSRTKASYTYVKDWMMLRECLAGCIGALQSISHQNVKLRLRLPEGSPVKFIKLSGGLEAAKTASGHDAEVCLGDLHYGDKRDVLVQLGLQPDQSADEAPSDHWDSLISSLQESSIEQRRSRQLSEVEIPVLEADLAWNDALHNGAVIQLPQPSLLAVTQLPARRPSAQNTPTPPHPHIVQRRLELLTSDMLARALVLVEKSQATRASQLLLETRSILNALARSNASPPPSPPPAGALPRPPSGRTAVTPAPSNELRSPSRLSSSPMHHRFPSPPRTRSPVGSGVHYGLVIDPATLIALDAELGSNLDWLTHPDVFARDSRKAILQAIGVISTQRAYTQRTLTETLWSTRLPGVRHALELSREWREHSRQSHVQ